MGTENHKALWGPHAPTDVAGDGDPGVFEAHGRTVPRGWPRGFVFTGKALGPEVTCGTGLARGTETLDQKELRGLSRSCWEPQSG